jgi:FkbM family methyltransferase
MKKFFIKTVSLLFRYIAMPEHVRDFFMWPLASRVLGRDYTSPFTVKAGFVLNAYLEDQLGRLALFYGDYQTYFWEPTTTRLVEKLVPGIQHGVIAGSHIGLTVLFARKAMGLPGVIHTFEPIPHLYEISKENFKLNQELGEIILNKKAIGDVPGHVTMTRDRIRSRILVNGANPKRLPTEEVPIVTLDMYCTEKNIESVDFVFLDVEGYEYKVLQGMEGVLKKEPPKDIIYEISFPYKDNLEAARTIENYLKNFGYSFFIINDDYNPTDYPDCEPPITLVSATSESYEKNRTLRYFNMYATLRPESELKKFAEIIS